jgi:hypothetical protein
MSRSRQFAFAGVALLLLGLFAPVASMPIVGSVNLFHNGDNPFGLAIIAACAVGICLTMASNSRWLLGPGFASLGALIWWFIRFRQGVNALTALGKDSGDSMFSGLASGIANAAAASMQIQWGIIVPTVGALLLIAAALQPEDAASSEDHAESDHWGYRSPSPWTIAAMVIAGISVMGLTFMAIKHPARAATKSETSEHAPPDVGNPLNGVVGYTVTAKTFKGGDFEDYISITATISNLGSKEIRAFKGHLTFTDLFGDEIGSYSVKEDSNTIPAGDRREVSRYYRYNQFVASDVKLKETALENMHVQWIPESVIFSDGSTTGSTD